MPKKVMFSDLYRCNRFSIPKTYEKTYYMDLVTELCFQVTWCRFDVIWRSFGGSKLKSDSTTDYKKTYNIP